MLPQSLQAILNRLPEHLRHNIHLKLFGLLKVPMIFRTGVRVRHLDNSRCEVVIAFKRRNKNHLGNLYFRVLAVGADVAGGLMAMHMINQGEHKISLVFKEFRANFLQRAEADTHFVCKDGDKIRSLLEAALTNGERVYHTVHITAATPSISNAPVAEFALTLSLKPEP